MQSRNILFPLIRSVVCGAGLSEEIKGQINPEILRELYKLSSSHSLAHIVAQALENAGMLGDDEISAKFREQLFIAAMRQEQLAYEQERACALFEQEKISHIPLKGAVIRAFYPEPWMRTSCDVDILIKNTDLDRASALLTDRLGFKSFDKSIHDIGFMTPGKLHFELHFDLINKEVFGNSKQVLSRVWDMTERANGSEYRLLMTDDMYYFFHIAHLAKHFYYLGGCGIRPILDLWVLVHRVEHDRDARAALLKEAGLDIFTDYCRKLAEVWFSDAEHDSVTRQMEDYILSGGVYGTKKNQITVSQARNGGKVNFILSRLFLKKDTMLFKYPILEKHIYLLPFFHVAHWFEVVFRAGVFKRSVNELVINKNVDADEQTRIMGLMKTLDLHE